jgi:DNA repair exonuclease SbcCD nuclease subunit
VAVYPGNTQGRHVNEPGERGCVLVEVEDGRTRRRFVPVDTVRWHRLEVPLSQLASMDALVAAMTEQVDTQCGEELEGHAVRFTLTGRGPLHRELAPPEALHQLEADVREQFAQRHPPVLVESLRNASRPELDFETVRLAGGFSGTVLAEAEALAGNAEAMATLWKGDAELRALSLRLRKLGVEAQELARPELATQAGLQVVELLHEEDEP